MRTFATLMPDDEWESLDSSQSYKRGHGRRTHDTHKANETPKIHRNRHDHGRHDRHDQHSHPQDARDKQQQQQHHAWPSSPNPTPYEIFGQARGAPYHKRRFYDLAKQYHPDLHHTIPDHLRELSTDVLLERYRLIVAANEILSHPARRKTYDRHGTGWESRVDSVRSMSREAYDAWREQPGSAAYNATWEDWERWRQANGGGGSSGGGKQEEQFMSNAGFALVVLVFVFAGGWAQMTRAVAQGSDILTLQEQHHRKIATSLGQQQASSAPLSRKDRVGSFLERREGWNYELSAGTRHGHVPLEQSGEERNK